MAPTTKLGPLDEREKAEFDNIGFDEIHACKDVKKLIRLEAYLRAEGFPPTADAVVARLRELGQRSANAHMDPEQARLLAEEVVRARAEIATWTATQRQTDAALDAASKAGSAGLHEGDLPPVRAPVRMPVSVAKPEGPAASQKPLNPKADSAVGTNVRSGRQYYDLWEKKAEAALAEADRDDNGNAIAQPGTAAAAASTAGLRRSPELTQRLLELNRGASSAERMCLSGVEKAKGNEHFRAKEYAEAVEHYTLALGLRGSAGEASVFGNRAAAYIKLKMWDAAEQDSSAALEADPTMLKAYIRRAAARMEMGKLAEAVADCDAALALQPGCKEAAELRARSAKLLQDAGMKRMVIEEVEDDDGDEVEGDKASPAVGIGGGTDALAVPLASGIKLAGQQSGTAPAPGRKRMVVVETDSEDSEDEAEASKGVAAAPVDAAQPLPREPAAPAASLAAAKSLSARPVEATTTPPVATSIAVAVKPEMPALAVPISTTPVPPVDPPAAAKAAKEAPRPAAPVATKAPPSPLTRAVPPPPPPPPVDLPPAPSPPAPTPPSQFDAAVEAIKQEGNKEYKSGNFVRASQLYTDALALAPDLATLYLNRSMARLSNGLNAEALRDACQAVALDPNGYKALNKRARAKEKLRLWEAARSDMRLCLDLVPPKEERIRNEVVKDFERAESNAAAAKERAAARAAMAAARAPQRVTKYKSVTIEEHDDEEEESDEDKPLLAPEEAVEWEDDAAQRLPKLRSRAEALRAEWLRKKDEEAREVYQRELLAWEAAKERAEAAAAAAAAEAEEAAAAAAATTAVAAASSAEPADVSSKRGVEEVKNEGNAHLRAHRYQEAENCYRECLRLDPGNLYVRVNMLVLLNETNRWTQAETAANEVLKLFAANQASLTAEQQQNMRSKVFHRRSLALKSQGRYLEALEDLRTAKALLGQSESLDKEMEALGKLIAMERKASAPASAGPAVAPLTPGADAAWPSALAITAELKKAAAAAAVTQKPGALPGPGQATKEAVVEQTQQVPSAAVSETSVPAAAAPAPAVPITSGGVGRNTGTGGAPVRRRMKVQVESDDDDDEGPSPPKPPEKSPASSASLTAAPVPTSASPLTAPALSSDSQTPATAEQPAITPTQATSAPVPASTAAAAPTPSARATSTSNIAALGSGFAADASSCAGATTAKVTTASVTTAKATTASATTAKATTASATTASATTASATTASATTASATTASATTASAKSGGGSRAAAISGDPGDPEEAGRLRDEGNRLYSVGNYVRAMDFYTRSIRACAHNPTAYCNRAFVYLHLHRPADALLDAEAAIEQSGGRYPKAQLRRAFALRDLGRITDAMSEVRQLLDASPGDQLLLDEMQRLQHMAMEEKKAAGKGEAAGRAQGNGVTAKPVANGGAPAQGAQAPPVRHRILVEDVSSDSEDEQAGTAAGLSKADASSNGGVVNGSSIVAAASSSGATVPQVSNASGRSKASTAVDATLKQAASAVGSPAGAAAPVPPPSAAASASAPGEAAASSTINAAGRTPLEAASAKAAAALAAAVATKVPKKPKPPKNAHELEQALKNLAGHPAVQYDYIRSLDPSSYAGVIKANLSVKMIQAFVDASRRALNLAAASAGNSVADAGGGAAAAAAVATPSPGQEDVDFALRSLENLTLVPRFDVTYGLSGKAMKEDVRALLGALAAVGKDVSLLKKSYKV
ncbi:hypothetical protein VaNZ11_007368 [Volvox africanus]|uniref:RNA-polymerase II-associated protein 3-like C-terminal domain-containing protein n=1 Tax=Volvox africanus TaxID=51714 RepID=A0ABQ5S4C8_9CHLO|nr:hypothetical protein VaNZ11_007368 [Volvox africanus]